MDINKVYMNKCMNVKQTLTSPLLLSWLVLCSESLLSRLLLSFGDRAQSTHMQASMLQLKMLRDNLVFILKKKKKDS